MSVVRWENPFETAKKALPDLWVPGRKVPPVDLGAIRERQRGLLPILRELLDAADQALNRITNGGSAGALLASALKVDVQVGVLYRFPDNPSLMTEYFTMPEACVPVAFPSNKKQAVPALDVIMPTQVINEKIYDAAGSPPALDAGMEMGMIKKPGLHKERKISEGIKQSILAAETEMGLVRARALAGCDEMPQDRIIVYRPVLNWATIWIENMDSPISDMRFQLVKKDRGIGAGAILQFGDAPVVAPRPH